MAAGIAPFELVVINLYPFAAAAERPGIAFDELVEEIDIGGPSLIRAAAKNHASVAVVTTPERYPAVLGGPRPSRTAVRRACGRPWRSRRSGTPPPMTPGSPRRSRPGWPGPGSSCPTSRACRASDPYPATLTIGLEKVETLRYGENPHQPAARYRTRLGRAWRALCAGAGPLQGKALSYNNVLDASAAAALGRSLRGPACVIVKHTNPCGAAERATLLEAWQAALAGDPVSAFGGVVALTGPVDEALAEALTAIFLEVVVAPGFEPAALAVLGRQPNLRLIVDPGLAGEPAGPGRADPFGSLRTVGGAVLVTSRDDRPMTRPAGRWPRAGRRRRPKRPTSTSPGGSSGARRATRSCSSATGA